MKTFAWATMLVAASFASTGWAAADGAAVTANPPTAATVKAPNAQQQKKVSSRMKDCNKQAGDQKLAGDARRTFMSSCLKAS